MSMFLSKVQIKLTFNKCSPVEGPLHWIEEFNYFFVLRLMRHLNTGRAGLMVFSQTILVCIYIINFVPRYRLETIY